MVGLSPSQFWNSSPIEVYMTIDGFIEFNGGSSEPEPMGQERLSELMELYPDE